MEVCSSAVHCSEPVRLLLFLCWAHTLLGPVLLLLGRGVCQVCTVWSKDPNHRLNPGDAAPGRWQAGWTSGRLHYSCGSKDPNRHYALTYCTHQLFSSLCTLVRKNPNICTLVFWPCSVVMERFREFVTYIHCTHTSLIIIVEINNKA